MKTLPVEESKVKGDGRERPSYTGYLFLLGRSKGQASR